MLRPFVHTAANMASSVIWAAVAAAMVVIFFKVLYYGFGTMYDAGEQKLVQMYTFVKNEFIAFKNGVPDFAREVYAAVPPRTFARDTMRGSTEGVVSVLCGDRAAETGFYDCLTPPLTPPPPQSIMDRGN